MSDLVVQVTVADEAGIGLDVAARVENLDFKSGEAVQQVVLRAGNEPTVVPVLGGTYNVEVTLPTGQRLNRVVVVGKNDRGEVVLDAGRSPGSHELKADTGSFQLKGNPTTFLRRSAPNTGSPRLAGGPRGLRPPVNARSRGPGMIGRAPSPAQALTLVVTDNGPNIWSAVIDVLTKSRDSTFAANQLRQTFEGNRWRYPEEGPHEEVGRFRRWAMLRRGRLQHLLSLPVPWLAAHGPDENTFVEIISEPEWAGVRVKDAKLGSLLAYMGNGQLRAAQPLLRDEKLSHIIEMAVHSKYRSPLAACAGAYVGLSSDDVEPDQRWYGWLENLANSFERIPDAQIIYARWLLIRPTGPADPDEIFYYLSRAYRAGLPFFTVGMQMLRDMLMLVSGDVEQARTLLSDISAVKRHVDARQLFLSLTYPRS